MIRGESNPVQCTEVRFASFLSGGFITVIAVNLPERRLAKRTFVHCPELIFYIMKSRDQTSVLLSVIESRNLRQLCFFWIHFISLTFATIYKLAIGIQHHANTIS